MKLIVAGFILSFASPLSVLEKDDFGLPIVPKENQTPVSDNVIHNPEAPIPPQCYTKTENRFNPCYVCHQTHTGRSTSAPRLNSMNDGSLQGSYDFSDFGATNRWTNLFADKTHLTKHMPDSSVWNYVNSGNYAALFGLSATEGQSSYIPDLENLGLGRDAFDGDGFARDGSGWVAFSYKPLPSTFWPTNGSADDVMIRLPLAFRTQKDARNSQLYRVNLAITEMAIKGLREITIPPTSETDVGTDLNGDGRLGNTDRLVWRDYFVGDAADIPVQSRLYPEGTEFLHSVRYLTVDGNGNVQPAKRMKELRYMKKARFLSPSKIRQRYLHEAKEKLKGKLPSFTWFGGSGYDNGFGWLIKGWIEDASGDLRPQSREETLFCMGCHSTIGATYDSTFSFARKVTGPAGWRYIDTASMTDTPSIAEAGGEIATYLKRVGGGDEFRENKEIQEKWQAHNSEPNRSINIGPFLNPSAERALALNKAYIAIVRQQSYIYGRDAVLAPATNIYREVPVDDIEPLSKNKRIPAWDIQLDWREETQ